MLHELDEWDKASFVTLTYQDKFLPVSDIGPIPLGSTLRKSDLQKFFKRLRKNSGRKIKYYACGEYGDNTQRPHYHAIIYGIGLNREDKDLVMSCWPYTDWRVPSVRNSAFGAVEPDSIRYVAQYIDKKYTGKEAEKHYTNLQREPVFRLLSQGLGKEYIYKNAQQLFENQSLTHRGVIQSIPRYYLNKLEEIGLRPDTSESLNERQSEQNQKLIGLWMSDKEITRLNNPTINNEKLIVESKAKKQHNLNLKAKLAQKTSKL